MDTTLAALKRSAKAILKDELKVLRAQVRMFKSLSSTLRFDLTASELALGKSRADHGRTQQRLYALRLRTAEAQAWAESNAAPHGNTVALALTQYVHFGPCPGSVHPFDRWNVSPKPDA